jgi:cytochrome c5
MNKLTGAGLVLATVFTTAALGDPSQRRDDGKVAYDAVCAGCHDTGKDGAPVTGRAQDWEGRSHLWEAVLFEHASKGFLKMPAKGGKEDMSEYDVEAAAEWMLTVSHPDLPED